jgi:hypothetical protein
LEPTPGYEILMPPPTLWQQIVVFLWKAGLWVVERWLLCLTNLLVVVALWHFRLKCLELLVLARWNCFPSRCPRRRIQQTARLLDVRLGLMGRPRSPGQTWSTVFDRLTGESTEARQSGLAFSVFANWAAFAPEGEPIPDWLGTRWEDACRRVVNSVQPIVLGMRKAARGSQ